MRKTNGYLLLPSSHESHDHGQQMQHEQEGADATCDVSVRNIECDVLSQRNAAFYYSRLPPWGRLIFLKKLSYHVQITIFFSFDYLTSCDKQNLYNFTKK